MPVGRKAHCCESPRFMFDLKKRIHRTSIHHSRRFSGHEPHSFKRLGQRYILTGCKDVCQPREIHLLRKAASYWYPLKRRLEAVDDAAGVG